MTILEQRDLLRDALIDLVGYSTRTELEQMAEIMKLLPAQDTTRVSAMKAINALIATSPDE